jgi:hypothetical protein
MLGAILGAITGLGGLLGGGAKAASDGRMNEAQLNVMRDRNALDAYGTAQGAQMQQGNLDLQRKGFTEDARGGRARQALIADLISKLAPTQINVPGIQQAQIQPGMQLGQGGQQAMAELMKQALAAQLAGDKFEGGNILKAPTQSAIPKAGLLEKIMGVGGMIGQGVGAASPMIEEIFKRKPAPYADPGGWD